MLPAVLSGLPAQASPGCPGCEGKTLRAKENFDSGNYVEAEQDLSDVVRTYEAETNSPTESAPYSVALQNLGLIYYFEGKLAEAEAAFSKALPFTQSAWGSDSLSAANNMHALARTLRRANRFSDAEPIMKRIIELREKALGSDHPLVGNAYLDLAVNLGRERKTEEADQIFQKVIQMRDKPGQAQRLLMALTSYQLFLKLTNASTTTQQALDDRIKQLQQLLNSGQVLASEAENQRGEQRLEIRLLPSVNTDTEPK